MTKLFQPLKQYVFKAEFTHTVSACVYRIALRFFYSIPWFCSIKVSNKKLQCNAENACGNQMCKRAFRGNPITNLVSLICLEPLDGALPQF